MLAKLPADRQVFLAAADLIEIHGHCKGLRQRREGFCVLGAISQAATGDPWKFDGHEEPCATFARQIGEMLPAQWNNAPERTKEEVVSALRATAFAGL